MHAGYSPAEAQEPSEPELARHDRLQAAARPSATRCRPASRAALAHAATRRPIGAVAPTASNATSAPRPPVSAPTAAATSSPGVRASRPRPSRAPGRAVGVDVHGDEPPAALRRRSAWTRAGRSCRCRPRPRCRPRDRRALHGVHRDRERLDHAPRARTARPRAAVDDPLAAPRRTRRTRRRGGSRPHETPSTWRLSQRLISPARQKPHSPQETVESNVTRSPGREALDLRADRLDHARGLVAHHQRRDAAAARAVVAVHVAAADAAGAHAHQHVAADRAPASARP